ncbi:MAG: glycosyltransferase family 2 protein, partial [Planctomycetota bacterium JB042]
MRAVNAHSPLQDVAVVVPNWNGRHHLERCFTSLAALDYPGRVEAILVDNGSEDGSCALMRRRFPEVRTIENARNEGFARACNAGARAASAPVVVFLNNDMRVDGAWLRELVGALDGDVRCAASKILSWDGKRVNYAGGGMNFHGIGIQLGLDDPDLAAWDEPADTLFACGGAMAIDRELFLEAGGFDEGFFAYYEDVDLGWRLWVRGETVRYVPSSIAYHHHSATSRRVDVHRLRRLQVRNPLLTLFKNYDDENLRRALPAALLLMLRRTKYMFAVNERGWSLGDGAGLRSGPLAALRTRYGAKLGRARVSRAGIADVLAINDLLDEFPAWVEKRREVQAARRRPDREIVPLFREPRWPAEKPA